MKLQKKDIELLEELELEIARNKLGFLLAGKALQVIHVKKLYRASHSTFAGYCADRWGFTDRHARSMIHASEAAKTDPTVSSIRQGNKPKKTKIVEQEISIDQAMEEVEDDDLSELDMATVEFESVYSIIAALKKAIKNITSKNCGKHLSAQGLETCIKNLNEEIKWGSPALDCPHQDAVTGRDGQHKESCACRGTRWLPNNQISQEKRRVFQIDKSK